MPWTAQHQLGLLDNAVDSLNEVLRQFESASETDLRPYKFAILHFAHFPELFFKYHVAEAHPLLVYKNPFSKRIEKEQTIGLWEAVQFLKNEGKDIDHEFWSDLEWLKGIRNDIEHHKFSIDTKEVRRVLGRLIRATNTFNDQFTKLNLYGHITPDCRELFDTLDDEYQARLAAARSDAREESPDGEVHECALCGEDGVAVERDGSYQCQFCGESDDAVECTRCGGTFPRSQATPLERRGERTDLHLQENCEAYIVEQD